MLNALVKLGFMDDAKEIKLRWKNLLAISGAKPTPEYRRCFPDTLIQQISEVAITGAFNIGCCVAGPNTSTLVYKLLNEAWIEFWRIQ